MKKPKENVLKILKCAKKVPFYCRFYKLPLESGRKKSLTMQEIFKNKISIQIYQSHLFLMFPSSIKHLLPLQKCVFF